MGVSETACGRGGCLDHCSLLINTPSPGRPGANPGQKLTPHTPSLAKKQYKVHFGATYLVICVGHASTFPCKKQYKVHFGATSWVICVGHASTFPCKKQYKVHFGATYLVIFVGPANTFPCKKQYKVHFGATSWVVCLGHASTFPCKKQYKVSGSCAGTPRSLSNCF